jgi:hypothetical protein
VLVSAPNPTTYGTTYQLGKFQAYSVRENLNSAHPFSQIGELGAPYIQLNIQDYFSNVFDIQ